ncbi:MAG: glycosyltransferase [Spirochaetaceae bacterium]|jgi:chlorobactene glucosyltransferase|nr:glycosyltransferase [Spirochaetaceae bacterium]
MIFQLPPIGELYIYLLFFVGLYFIVLDSLNSRSMRRSSAPPLLEFGPLVSVLIPARNEEENIERCVNSLSNQTYKNYEILVLDDNSEDRTGEILKKLAAGQQNLRVLQGKPLPEGWNGKPFAMKQLVEAANGEILLMTDADTVHEPTSVSWAASNIIGVQGREGVEMVSGYTKQIFGSLGEFISVMAMFMLTSFFIPIFLNRKSKAISFSVAVGQYIVIKKLTVQKTNVFEALRSKTGEDIFMARFIKFWGFKTRFAELEGQCSCRMYKGYKEAVRGIGKNIFDFFENRSWVMLLIIALIFFFMSLPFPLLVYDIIRFCILGGQFPSVLLAANVLYTIAWTITLKSHKLPLWSGLLWPLGMLNLMVMGFYSWFSSLFGKGYIWKGRKVG